MAMGEFYERFEKDLKHAEEHMTDIKRMEKPTDLMCEKCGKPLVIKWGKHGSFIACTGYPECTNTRELTVDLAGRGQGRPDRAGRRGILRKLRTADGAEEGPLRTVLRVHGISGLQNHQADWRRSEKADVALDEKCPQCGNNLVQKYGRYRRVHGVQQLSEVQVREAEDHRA